MFHFHFNKKLGAAKVKVVLLGDYGIHISSGRVFRLMNQMQLPKKSTIKPRSPAVQDVQDFCPIHLKQKFNPPEPSQVWVSDITYIKVSERFAGDLFTFVP